MGYGGCYSFMKYLVFLINTIFWVAGLGIIGLAIWLLTDNTFYISLPQEQLSYNVSAYLLLAIGILLFAAGFFGCCGIIIESPFLLVLYFCVVLIVTVAEVSAGVWAYSYQDEVKELVRLRVKSTVLKEYGQDEGRTTAFDAIQKELECCGADGPEDWLSVKSQKVSLFLTSSGLDYHLPASCCATEDPADPVCIAAISAPLISPVIFKEGCTDKLLEVLGEYTSWLTAVTALLVVCQLIALVFSVSLCYSLTRSTRYKA